MPNFQSDSELLELGARIVELTHSLRKISDTVTPGERKETSDTAGSQRHRIHDALIPLLNEMLEKIQGPTRTFITMTNTARVRLSVVRTIIHFDLATNVPLEGSRSFTELASSAGVKRPLLERLFRFAFSQGIFRETAPGSEQVSHTELSKIIPPLAPWLKLVLSPLTTLPDLSLPEALEWTLWISDTAPAAELALKENFWKTLRSGGHLGLFHEALRSLSAAQRMCSVSGEGDLFRWEELAPAVIVDIGGGDGRSAVEAAKKNPKLHFIVQDLEEIREYADERIPQDLKTRVLFQAHDFFTVQRRIIRQPVTFFMRWILHDWSDAHCVEILTQLLPLLVQEGSRLLVQEYMLEDDSHIRAMDMTMLTLFNSGERYLSEFEAVFSQVDGRLKIIKVWNTEEWGMKLLDVRIVPQYD